MITVYGLLGTPSAELRQAVQDADWVVGGQRHLDTLSVAQSRRITLGSIHAATSRLGAMAEADQVIVLASGDPLFFGVVRTLRAAGLTPRVVSAPSSVQTAFAAVGLPWEDAEVVSVHGRPLAPAVNLARANPKVAVLTSAENSIRQLATALIDRPRWFVLAERLGEPDQRVRVLTHAQAVEVEPVEPNVVLILDSPPAELNPDWAGQLARPSRAKVAQVSAAAAVIFARLLPEPGELLWAEGPLAAEVSALAAWAGAAVARPGVGGTPEVILTADSELLNYHRPRAVALTEVSPITLPPHYHWQREQIGEHLITTGVLS